MYCLRGAIWQKLLCVVQSDFHTVFLGYGQTGGHSLQNDQKPHFVEKLIESLRLKKPVLVSPSMSGSFSLPFVMSNPNELMAYVPVAPVGTGDYTPEQYQKIKVYHLGLNLVKYRIFITRTPQKIEAPFGVH